MFETTVLFAKSPTTTEFDLGTIAHFTHTPIGSGFPLEDDSDSVKRVTLAVACLKRKHLSIFEFADRLFYVECPIFVARQLFRHRNGVFMEKSLRCLLPIGKWLRHDSKENPVYTETYENARKLYFDLVESKGERKELARAVLPLATPTAFLWKINLRSLLNVFDQRLDLCAQAETRAVVQKMYDLTAEYYPNVMNEWKLEHERL